MHDLLPAIIHACRTTPLGAITPLDAAGLLVRIALFCCYCSSSPKRLCMGLPGSSTGLLSRQAVLTLLRMAIPSAPLHRCWDLFGEWQLLAK
jgi:hypothetical protein